MPPIPYVRETARDYGLNATTQASMMPVVAAPTSSGAANVLEIYNDPQSLRDARGFGAGVEFAAHMLAVAGGPIGFVGLDSTITGTNGSVSGGSGLALSGEAYVDAHLRVEITKGGALGVAQFRYSFDGYTGDTAAERTYSEVLTVPGGGTYAIPGLGITLTFSGTLVLNTPYQADVQQGASNATDLAAAMNVLKATNTPWRFVVPVTSKANGDAAAHALLVTALQTHLDGMIALGKHRRGMIAAAHGESAAAVATAYAAITAIRVLIAFGEVRRATQIPVPGFAFPVTGALDCIAARAASSLLSTDLKRVASGDLENVVKTFDDEFATPTGLDDIKISTLRTWDTDPGVYITQAWLKSPAGSDYDYWPKGLIMDVACETAHRALVRKIGVGVRTATRSINGVPFPGTIDDRDAVTIEQDVQRALDAQLKGPNNAEGFAGHVQDVVFEILRTHNVQQTKVVKYRVSIVPFTYIDGVDGELGYVGEVPVG